MIKYILPIAVIALGYLYYSLTISNVGDAESAVQGTSQQSHTVNGQVQGQEEGHDHHGHSQAQSQSKEGFAPSQNLPSVQKKFDENRFAETFPGDWKFDYPESGAVQLTGGKIPLNVNKDGDVIRLAQGIVAQFGIDPMQVSPQVDRPAETKYGQNLKTYQHHHGMLVYASSMTLYVGKKSGEVSIIENGFKKIESLDLTQTLRPEEAGEILTRDQGVKLLNRGEAMIYVAEGKGVTVYRFEHQKNGDNYESLVSAESGDVLFKRPLFVR